MTVSFPPEANAQSVVYRQTFNNPDASNRDFAGSSNYNWNVFRNGFGEQNFATTSLGISNATGRPQDLAPINATIPNGAGNPNGLFFNTQAWGGDLTFYYTTEHTVARASFPALDSISWWQGNVSVNTIYQVAVRIGSDWFISSNQTQTQATGVDFASNFNSQAVQILASVGSLSWETLALSGNDLVFGGSPVSLPGTGDFTGFGLMAAKLDTQTHRFDTFTVSAIPEPGSLTLLGFACVLLLATRRRKF